MAYLISTWMTQMSSIDTNVCVYFCFQDNLNQNRWWVKGQCFTEHCVSSLNAFPVVVFCVYSEAPCNYIFYLLDLLHFGLLNIFLRVAYIWAKPIGYQGWILNDYITGWITTELTNLKRLPDIEDSNWGYKCCCFHFTRNEKYFFITYVGSTLFWKMSFSPISPGYLVPWEGFASIRQFWLAGDFWT